jgi:hypothetical protein
MEKVKDFLVAAWVVFVLGAPAWVAIFCYLWLFFGPDPRS